MSEERDTLSPEFRAVVEMPTLVGSDFQRVLRAAFPEVSIWGDLEIMRLGNEVRRAAHEATMRFLRSEHANPHAATPAPSSPLNT